ncbi:MAG: hypothetical protein V7459_14885 [Oceanicoccus sp.]
MPDPKDHSDKDRIQNKKNRKVILAIFGIPVAILLFSSLLYFLVETRTVDLGTVNNGELIVPPLQLAEQPLSSIDGQAFDYSKPEPKWAFVVIGDSHCVDSCERMLYIARQSIIALAKKMNRVRLMYITTDGSVSSEFQQRIDTEYIGMDIVSLSRGAIGNLFSGSDIEPFKPNTFYVVDQHGWLMMHYQVDNTEQDTLNGLGKAVVRDMKRLIK